MSPVTSFRIAWLLLALLAGFRPQAAALSDIYLQLPDIPGSSADPDHLKWIVVDSFSHSITSTAPLPGGGGGTPRPVHGLIKLRKRLDASSPKLSLACGNGVRMPFAALEFHENTGKPGLDSLMFYRLDLAEVSIISILPEGSILDGSETPTETVEISYKAIQWNYTPINPQGVPQPDLLAWWNTLVNRGGDTAVDCLTVEPAVINDFVGHRPEVTITIPPLLNAANTVGVWLVSSDPTVVSFTDSADGRMLLAIPEGAPPVVSAAMRLLRPGQATLHLERNGTCVANSVIVTVRGSLVRNPSFEDNYPPDWPHYGSISGWTGIQKGVNRSLDPFLDNGAIPDRTQVAFIQGSSALDQDVSGLDPTRNYWLQFRYNARNCCGGTIGLTVLFAGKTIATIPAVKPVGGANGFAMAQIEFQPTAAAGRLEFKTQADGDATMLIDAVSLVQRNPGEVVVRNPSFEASGVPAAPGYLQPVPLDGWIATGNFGVNQIGDGPFADNGLAPDQGMVAFLQNAGSSLRQYLGGLVAGNYYTLSFAANARSGNTPRLKVSFDDQTLLDFDLAPVGGDNPYPTHQAVFRAGGPQGWLGFEQTATGDQTALLDDVHVVPGTPPGWLPVLRCTRTALGIRLAWPQANSGFRLQSSTRPDGGWADAPLPTVTEPDEFAVYLNADPAVRFFRLRQ